MGLGLLPGILLHLLSGTIPALGLSNSSKAILLFKNSELMLLPPHIIAYNHGKGYPQFFVSTWLIKNIKPFIFNVVTG